MVRDEDRRQYERVHAVMSLRFPRMQETYTSKHKYNHLHTSRIVISKHADGSQLNRLYSNYDLVSNFLSEETP